MRRHGKNRDDVSERDDETLGEIRPEDLGIDTSRGPDLILGRDLRRAEAAARRGEKGRPSRESEPFVPYLVLEQLSDLAPLPVTWLWPGRIPLARLTLIAGEPQVGKSLVALDIAARVSRGAAWPDAVGPAAAGNSQSAGNVLILGWNSIAAADIVPRLGGPGADLSKIFFADGVFLPYTDEAEQGWKRPISLADDLGSLDKTIRELSPVRLVILDPLWAFTGARGIRQAARIAQLAELAAESGAAIVGVTDLVRDHRGRGALRVKGERALAEAAHTVWGIVPHPEDDEMRVLLPLKTDSPASVPGASGLGDPGYGAAESGKAGLEFLIAAGQIAWDSQPSPLTVESVLASERYGGELEAVEEWLRKLLSGGSLPARQVFAQARECGVSMGTLRRAKVSLGVQVERHGDHNDPHWIWSLGGVDRVQKRTLECARIDEITCAPCEKPAELIEVAAAVPLSSTTESAGTNSI